MTLRSRIALFFNIRTSAALDQVEDPREVLDYAYGQQQLQLRTLKRGLVEVAAARRQLERQADGLRARVARLEDQARRALRAEREDLARAALQRKQATLRELESLDTQLGELGREEERLSQADRQLSQSVERFRLHRTVLSARYSAAEAQARVGEALSGLLDDEHTELSLAVERSEERVDRLSARAVAIDALIASGTLVGGPSEDPVERELNEIGSTEAIERELDALRRELEPAEGEDTHA
jgi:phage shock protein A